MEKMSKSSYMSALKDRGAKSRAYTPHQAVGTEIAEILDDESYIAMYIKLVKEGDEQELLALAKDVASRSGIKNKGAYFLKVLKERKKKIN